MYDNEDIILMTVTGPGEDDNDHKAFRKGRRCGSPTRISRFVHGPGIDEPLAIEQKGKVYFYHADGLGSIVNLTDPKGKVVQGYNYSAFGALKQHGHKVEQPYTYTAREWDQEIGLYYYRARYYDPQVGRFISKDPIGFNGGINFYSYVSNNPVNHVDPSGLLTGVGDLFAWGGIKTAEYAVKGISYLAGKPMTDEQFQKMDESLMGSWEKTTTATPYAAGAGVTLVTGNPEAGAWATYGTDAIINGIAGKPVGDPFLGIEWLNPPSLNENEPCSSK